MGRGGGPAYANNQGNRSDGGFRSIVSERNVRDFVIFAPCPALQDRTREAKTPSQDRIARTISKFDDCKRAGQTVFKEPRRIIFGVHQRQPGQSGRQGTGPLRGLPLRSRVRLRRIRDAPQKIRHVLGVRWNLPHAQTRAVVLPPVLAFNAPTAKSAAARIATAPGSDNVLDALTTLRDKLEVPAALKNLGFREENIPEAVQLILAAIPGSNPQPVTGENLTSLLQAAYAGTAS